MTASWAPRLKRLPRAEWVFGRANASVVIAAFLHGGTARHALRRTDLGAWYASSALGTLGALGGREWHSPRDRPERAAAEDRGAARVHRAPRWATSSTFAARARICTIPIPAPIRRRRCSGDRCAHGPHCPGSPMTACAMPVARTGWPYRPAVSSTFVQGQAFFFRIIVPALRQGPCNGLEGGSLRHPPGAVWKRLRRAKLSVCF